MKIKNNIHQKILKNIFQVIIDDMFIKFFL